MPTARSASSSNLVCIDSSDEVFGSFGEEVYFSVTIHYNPSNPFSASKATSDHKVSAWHHNDGLRVHNNCNTNYGPWQSSEKPLPLYGVAIDPSRISTELDKQPLHKHEEGLAEAVPWYLEQKGWCDQVRMQRGYSGDRLGIAFCLR